MELPERKTMGFVVQEIKNNSMASCKCLPLPYLLQVCGWVLWVASCWILSPSHPSFTLTRLCWGGRQENGEPSNFCKSLGIVLESVEILWVSSSTSSTYSNGSSLWLTTGFWPRSAMIQQGVKSSPPKHLCTLTTTPCCLLHLAAWEASHWKSDGWWSC